MQSPAATAHYLEATVVSAPPARLRLMLIERGGEIARWLATQAGVQADALAEAGQSLRLRDILGELLAGVAAGQSQLATQVSDLYVFLLQHLTRAEQDGDRRKYAQIADVLEIERETWAEVCAAGSARSAAADTRSPAPLPLAIGDHAHSAGRASLNLQG